MATTTADDALVRCFAAVSVTKLTNGAITDEEIVTGLKGPYEHQPGGDNDIFPALCAIFTNGKTNEVRDAAMALLTEKYHFSGPLDNVKFPPERR